MNWKIREQTTTYYNNVFCLLVGVDNILATFSGT